MLRLSFIQSYGRMGLKRRLIPRIPIQLLVLVFGSATLIGVQRVARLTAVEVKQYLDKNA